MLAVWDASGRECELCLAPTYDLSSGAWRKDWDGINEWFALLTDVGIQEQEDDGEPFEEKVGRLISELSKLFERSMSWRRKSRRDWRHSGMSFD